MVHHAIHIILTAMLAEVLEDLVLLWLQVYSIKNSLFFFYNDRTIFRET
jgi:hypothetical protein